MDEFNAREYQMVRVPTAHEFDAALGAVWGMRYHHSEYTDGDIVRAVFKELFGFDLAVRER